MPLELSDFPLEVQMAFFISAFLEDNWDGASGAYMGKVWANLEYLFKIYEIQEPKVVIHFMKLIENSTVSYRAEKDAKKRKADERKSKSGAGNYTHNVKG